MLSCKEVTELCSLEMERSLPWAQRLSLRVHLMMCSGCSNFRRQMKILRQTAQVYADGRALPTDSEQDSSG